jgi:four helix bundle protein
MEDNRPSERPPFDLCERTFQFAVSVVNLSLRLEKDRRVPRALITQLLRAGTSVGANVEEGQAGQSKKDFVSKYSIARKEIREARYWLRLLVASDLLAPPEGNPLISEAEELRRILTSIIMKARRD